MICATCACLRSKQEEEKASERGVSKCVEWHEAPGAGFSDGQRGRPETDMEVLKCQCERGFRQIIKPAVRSSAPQLQYKCGREAG